MLCCPRLLGCLLGELGAGNLALGTELGGSIAFMNIAAYGANPFLHSKFPPRICKNDTF
jgi:hypothetical protein